MILFRNLHNIKRIALMANDNKKEDFDKMGYTVDLF